VANDLPVLFHLLLPLPVRLLFALDGAGLGVPIGCGELLTAEFADLLALLSPFLLAALVLFVSLLTM
jgi:hypothetical protein